jgi:phosphatidylinositol-3-phosphatase
MFMKFRFRRPFRAVGAASRRAVPWHGDSVVRSAIAAILLVIIAVVSGLLVTDQHGVVSRISPSAQAVAQNNASDNDTVWSEPRMGRPSSTSPLNTAVQTTPTAKPAPSTPRPPVVIHKAAPPVPSRPHLMVIMEENKGYGATLGSCAADPYYCSLAASYATDTSWYGISHPSAPNYVAFVSGGTQGVSSDCTPPSCGPFNVPSLGGQLTAAGIPWRAYMEGMPSACSAVASSGLYAEKHNPFLYFNDVRSASNCTTVEQPYPGVAGLVSALTGAGAPDFVWITPNLAHDMHDGSVAAGDAWLRANLAPVLASSWFTAGNATVIVTMDENDAASTPAGGQVPMVVISSKAKGMGAVTTHGNHYGALRSIEETYRLGLLGGAASSANGDLTGLFGGPLA